MNPDRYQRIKRIFAAASEQPAEQRGILLDRECDGDETLRSDIESLLQHEQSPILDLERESSRVLNEFLLDHAESPQAALERIGEYEIIETLGEGGMGVVYLARQANPRREVALKIVRGGPMASNAARRLAREAETLARLHHPGIAQVFEAGATEISGVTLPFFAMERVHGRPLNEFLHERNPDERRRLELIAAVCDAVDHAHTHGVVHRDLKPANILIESAQGEGHPKILDFGIARLTDSDLQVTTLRTHTGELVGTLPYMSPEQVLAQGDIVDHRTDVYSIGVILFETLTGRLPHEVKEKSIAEAARIIAYDEPTRLGSVARTMRGDLETIVAKAMEKDPDRRYQSTAALAHDIRRYLANEPIVARAPSTWYQARKFARRNRMLVASVFAVFAVLVGGIAATSWQMVEANTQRRRAEDEVAAGREVSNFLHDALSSVDPAITQNREITVREALDQASDRLEDQPFSRPLVQASLHRTIGLAYKAVGAFEPAESHLRVARDLRIESLGPGDVESLAATNELILILDNLVRPEAAEPLARETLALAEREVGDNAPETSRLRTALANVLITTRQYEEAEQLYRRSLQYNLDALGPEARETLIAMSNLALCLTDTNQLDEADELLTKCVAIRERDLGTDHPETFYARNNLAKLRGAQGRLDEADAIMADLISRSRIILGERHPHLLAWIRNRGVVLLNLGKLDEAARVLEEANPLLELKAEQTHPGTIHHLGLLAMIYLELNRLDEAESVAIQVRDLSIAVFGEQHLETIRSATLFYELAVKRGDVEQRDRWAGVLRGTPFDPAAGG